MGFVKDFFEVDDELGKLIFEIGRRYAEGELNDEMLYVIDERAANREAFLHAVGNWYLRSKSLLAGWEAEHAEILKAIADGTKAFQKDIEFCEFLIRRALPITEECVDEDIAISWRKSTAIEIDDEEKLDMDYLGVVYKPNRIAIKEALELGKEVTGARLAERFSPKVEPGGPAAIKRAKAHAKKKEKEIEQQAKAAKGKEARTLPGEDDGDTI